MPLISRTCIENIKERVNIEDVVAQYVTLKRSGSSWKGLSPFNNEKTASFYVLPEKNIFKCFSSGYAGDIFRFIQLKENLSFQEAIESIAHRFNIPLEYEEGTHLTKESTSLKKEIYEIHEIVAHLFRSCFVADTEEGRYIRDYWEKERKFSLNTAAEFSIGLAPIDGTVLIQLLLKKKRFSIEGLRESGLFFVRERETDPKRFLSRFRGRLMIPICDIQGRVIAFAGRQLSITPEDDPAKEAKYINSPETPIFHKGKVLFGLDRARQHIAEEGFFILVEGQLDALKCWEKGIKTAIAPQGTGITDKQLGTLRRYSSKIYSLLDSDSAGQKASLRILPIALKEGLDISFILLPQGADPDSYLSKEGPEAFKKEFRNAQSPMKFAIQAFWPYEFKPSAQEKAQVLEKVFEIIVRCESSVLQDEYLLEVCHILNINRQNIQMDFQVFKKSQRTFRKRNDNDESIVNIAKEKLTTVEYQLLLIILNYENIASSIVQQINPEWIMKEFLEGKLLLRIISEIREGLWNGVSSIDTIVETDEERNFMYSILGEEFVFEEPVKAANHCLKALFIKFIDEKRRKIDEQIAHTSSENYQIIRELQQKRIELRKLNQNPPQIKIALQIS